MSPPSFFVFLLFPLSLFLFFLIYLPSLSPSLSSPLILLSPPPSLSSFFPLLLLRFPPNLSSFSPLLLLLFPPSLSFFYLVHLSSFSLLHLFPPTPPLSVHFYYTTPPYLFSSLIPLPSTLNSFLPPPLCLPSPSSPTSLTDLYPHLLSLLLSPSTLSPP